MSLSELWREIFGSFSSHGKQNQQGTTRLTWSPEFMEGAEELKKRAISLGYQSDFDGFGNLWITIPGKDKTLSPIYTGSHMDSVPHGGSLDGALGITAGLACAAHWKVSGYTPKRTVHVIGFAEEEGTRFGQVCLGSRAITGDLDEKIAATFKTKAGITLEELRAHAGIKGNPFTPLIDSSGKFLELHIEQGGILEEDGLSLGVVSAIVGIRHYTITIEGAANHAGTTMMNQRHDALVAASHFIKAIYDRALKNNRKYVATVGQISLVPNAINVVPGSAELSLELRSEDPEIMDKAEMHASSTLDEIAALYHVTISMKRTETIPPLSMNRALMKTLEQAAKGQSVPYEILPSWAGHDAMIMGRHMATAMLFVPSIGGISHSPLEKTNEADIEKALSVLDKALRELSSQ